MYKDLNRFAGDYLASEQTVPQNTTVNGDGGGIELNGTLGSIQIAAEVTTEIALANTQVFTITLQDSADNSTFADIGTLYTITASGATTISVGTILGKFTLSEDVRQYVRCRLTSDDAAMTGAVSVYPNYLAR